MFIAISLCLSLFHPPQLCVVVNDLEHLRSVLIRLPQQLNWAGLRERTLHVIGDPQFHNVLNSQLQHAQGVLSREIRSALETVGRKVGGERAGEGLDGAESKETQTILRNWPIVPFFNVEFQVSLSLSLSS